MPETASGMFRHTYQTNMQVGECGFFLHEDDVDGLLSVRKSMVMTCGNLFGLHRQEIWHKSAWGHLPGNHFVGLYSDADAARQDYIEYAQWALKHRFKNPNRPGDQIGIKSIQEKVNQILRTNLPKATKEAEDWFEQGLKKINLEDPPEQKYSIGEEVVCAKGNRVTIALAELFSASVDVETGERGPAYIRYTDSQGYTVDVE